MIDVEDLSISFGSVRALRNVDLDVERGEIVGLIGPNGAGKTTVLSAINGLVEPTRGRVTLDGDDVSTLSARTIARRVATVPQETALSFAFPVREVVAMGRTPYRSRFERVSRTDREHTRRAMERTDVAHLADRTIDEISGGERQRVVLARALCQDTPVLVLDEPTASLDVNHQLRTLDLVREFVADGRAVLCAIHDLSLAARYCDRIVLLADGRTLAAGTPETVLTEAHVEHAFDTDATVVRHPVTGAVDVTATSTRSNRGREGHVHVVGGGAPSARAIAVLSRAGFDVSAGVLSSTDAACTTAAALGVETVSTAPFAPVDGRARKRTARLIRGADVTVVAGELGADGTNRTLATGAERLVVVDDDTNGRGPRYATRAHVVAIEDLPQGVETALDADPRRPETLAADD